jgi:hypothetical protein
MEIDRPTVQTIITSRSVSEPRTYATASASATEMIVSSTATVEHGERGLRRAENLRDLSLLPMTPRIAGHHLPGEDQELDPVGLIDAQLAADVLDLLRAAHPSRQHVRRVAADPVEEHEDEQHHPEHRRDHLPRRGGCTHHEGDAPARRRRHRTLRRSHFGGDATSR